MPFEASVKKISNLRTIRKLHNHYEIQNHCEYSEFYEWRAIGFVFNQPRKWDKLFSVIAWHGTCILIFVHFLRSYRCYTCVQLQGLFSFGWNRNRSSAKFIIDIIAGRGIMQNAECRMQNAERRMVVSGIECETGRYTIYDKLIS